jgi:hypothetical protein
MGRASGRPLGFTGIIKYPLNKVFLIEMIETLLSVSYPTPFHFTKKR